MEDTTFDNKPSGSVGVVALDLVRRVFGGARARSSYCNSKDRRVVEGYSRLDRDCGECSCSGGRRPVDVPEDGDDGEDELVPLTRWARPRQRRRSSFSSTESSKRWSSTDQYYHRRRKGFYCMRLRIVNMARLVAMMRKVRVAYRRMVTAAAASKTILSLADLYNDISELIPAPGSSSKASTIVVIRPIKSSSVYAIDESEDEDGSDVENDLETGSESTLTSLDIFKCEKSESGQETRQHGGRKVKPIWPPPASVLEAQASALSVSR